MLDKLTRLLVYILVFLLPVFALPVSLDPLEVNKQTLLVILTLGASLAWIASMIAQRKFEFRKGWLNMVPLVVLLATVASAMGSPSPYLSWIGGSMQEYLSVLTVFSLTLLFYVVMNRLNTDREHRVVHGLLLLSATIAGAVGLWSAFHGETSNTVGTLNALGVYMAAMAVFGCGLLVASRPDHSLLHGGWVGRVEMALVAVVSLEALALLLVLDYSVLWFALLLGLLFLAGFAILRAREIHDLRRFVLPFLLLAVSVLYLLWLPSPFRVGLPTEVTPSFKASVMIGRSVLDGPSGLFGSGPGTFAFDYGLLHTADVNTSPLWSQRFDRAASYAHTIAPALGVVGLSAFGLFFLAIFFRGMFCILGARTYRDWAAVFVDFSAWSVFAVAAFLYPGNMTSVFFLFVLGALLAAQISKDNVVGSFDRSPKIAYAFTTFVVLISLGIVTVMFVGAQRYASEAALASAVRLSEAGGDTQEIVDNLDRAARLNRYNDTAYRSLATALLIRVGEELEGVTDVSAIAADKRQYVQALSAASVNAAVRATELSPRNALNWMTRGAVYRELMPLIGNASDFAIAAYAQATALEPVNPAAATELGKTYLTRAESVRELTASSDPAVAADAKATLASALASAETALTTAIALKADYAPAHYQLALVYERQGRLSDSIGKMESVRKYNPLDVGVAFQLGLLYLSRAEPGDLGRAQAEFERSIELAPAYANARWFLASIYEQQGNIAGAIEQVSKVLEYNPGNEIVKARLERLKAGQISKTIPKAIEEPAP